MCPQVLSITQPGNDGFEIPKISADEPIGSMIRKLSKYIIQAIPDTPYSFDQMRGTAAGSPLKKLAISLADEVHNPALIKALMDIIEYLLDELPDTWTLPTSEVGIQSYVEEPFSTRKADSSQDDYECRPLLYHARPFSRLFGYGTRTVKNSQRSSYNTGANPSGSEFESDEYGIFAGFNALEIAIIANAKKFVSQTVVQEVVNGMWTGEIILWDTLSVHSKKKPQLFHKRMTDPYCRLRVPVYRKTFEAVFFLSFIALYYYVLMARDPLRISPVEILLVCSLMSLNSYFGSLIPVLKEMTKALLKFLPVVAILYIDFASFRLSPYVGIRLHDEHSLDIFGYEFNELEPNRAADMCDSKTDIVCCKNLIPLFCIRPLRLFLSNESIRRVRIVLLKVTHSPFVGIILAYESSRRYVTRKNRPSVATSSSLSPAVGKIGSWVVNLDEAALWLPKGAQAEGHRA
ncbi:conserved hypothetical protein [Histoplasma capsulatum G186AR]|uniref:Uncharacterized protein n=1 Tax=Ajellomyces capsulatus (strain G186AR / H82 / ATCC MYA-2454 / RMSCC 2432) TaxID=447093 RepID=C0NPL4_AJECG|nr:uncharacterized protein HCBG_05094 [Histoplasma capsulatum G186AR]EEH06874.1 conserved hypothetical protein [Histoplasma capsulatum G186AR]